MIPPTPLSIDAARTFALLPWAGAVAALRGALLAGLDPSTQPPRSAVETDNGELLIMPSEFGGMAGVKVVSVAPANVAAGRPRIQGTFILMDAATLTPLAVLDGSALTTLRTPALSAVAVDACASPDARRLVVFGAGPQAEGHVDALRAIRPIDDVRIVSRTAESGQALVRRLAGRGVPAHLGVAGDVADTDLIVTATTSGVPLFDGALVPDHSVVAAVGSHHPDRRELDAALMRRAVVVIEDPATAMREAGDVVMAISTGDLRVEDLLSVGDIVRRKDDVGSPGRERPVVIKTVGQGWQDLVVAHAVFTEAQKFAAG